jgi:hypothetical protein
MISWNYNQEQIRPKVRPCQAKNFSYSALFLEEYMFVIMTRISREGGEEPWDASNF